MTWWRGVAQRARSDQGAALVMVAVWLPLLVLMAGFAIGVADWFAHKRHLQMEADAAALAGAGSLTLGGGCNDDTIKAAATQYSGVTTGGSQYNAQIPPSTNVQFDSSPPSPYQPSLNAHPCTDKFVDVNLKDSDPGSFFLNIMPTIRAHARVKLYEQTAGAGGVPISVAANNPKSARVFIVDESNNNAVLYSAPLDCHPDPSTHVCPVDVTTGLIDWDSAASPMAFDPHSVTSGHKIGVRVVLSDGTTAPTTCVNDVRNVCYSQVDYIDTWSSTPGGSATSPKLRGVTLVPASSCSDAYYSTGSTGAQCSVRVSAAVDFGVTDPTSVGATLKATIGSQKKVTMTYNSTTKLWTSSPITVDPEVGALPVTLDWTTSSCNGGSCKPAPFTTAQRTFSAGNTPTDPNNPGGPIRALVLSESKNVNGTPTEVPDANSFQICSTACPHNLIMRMAIGGLELSKVGSKPVKLRSAVNGDVGSQSLDCDPGLNVFTEISQGCSKPYQINDGTPCTTPTTPFPSCVPVTSAGGDKVGQIKQGINMRVFGTTTPTQADCAAHPDNFRLNGGNIPAGDTRAVKIFVTPLGTFTNNSTNDPVPIENFAGFYLSGWDGDPCTTAPYNDPVAGKSEIWGYFITYVDHLNSGGGTQDCSGDPNSITPCVAVLDQ